MSEERSAQIRARRAAIGEGRWFAYESTVREKDETADSEYELGSIEVGRMHTRAANEFVGGAPADIDYLLERERHLLSLLKRLEWVGDEDGRCPCCPICLRREDMAHKAYCWLGGELAEQEATP